jgi:hypothetical protein
MGRIGPFPREKGIWGGGDNKVVLTIFSGFIASKLLLLLLNIFVF